MWVASLSPSYVSNTLAKKVNGPISIRPLKACAVFPCYNTAFSSEAVSDEESSCKRRLMLLGVGTLVATSFPANSLLAEEVPKNYSSFVDRKDGYSYVYPSDWREFDFRAHDSAFKDRYLQLQNVRVRFIPTDKKDIHDLGPMEDVVYDLVKHKYAAPNQVATIYSMNERTENGKNYYTFEYGLVSRNYATTSFATVAIGNERYYTLIVAANERRWRRFRKQLKVVADSFEVLDV